MDSAVVGNAIAASLFVNPSLATVCDGAICDPLAPLTVVDVLGSDPAASLIGLPWLDLEQDRLLVRKPVL